MFLKENGVTLTILRGRSVLEDYASFFYAPYLISSGQSSLSFVPGSRKADILPFLWLKKRKIPLMFQKFQAPVS